MILIMFLSQVHFFFSLSLSNIACLIVVIHIVCVSVTTWTLREPVVAKSSSCTAEETLLLIEFVAVVPRGKSGAAVCTSFLTRVVPSWERRHVGGSDCLEPGLALNTVAAAQVNFSWN